MKKKILIIDYTTHHPQLVKSLCSLFGEHQLGLVVTESFRKKFGKGLQLQPQQITIKPKKIADKSWLAQLAPLLAQQDIVIFSTAMRSPLLQKSLALQTQAKKVVFVHNTHYFTENFPLKANEYHTIAEPDGSRIKSMMHYTSKKTRHIRKNIKHTLQGSRFVKIAPLVDFFCFGSEHLARYFTALSGYANALTLPTNVQSIALAKPAFNGTLKLAILGSIAADRRDYLATIAALDAAQLDCPVELHLLGACKDDHYAQQLQAMIDALTNTRLCVKFDRDHGFIPDDQFAAKLQSIHLLFAPIRLDFSFQFYRERYGLTKISGAESDCVAFNRPILLPRDYLCSKRVEPYVVYYEENRDLAATLNSLANSARLDALYDRIARHSTDEANRTTATEFLQLMSQPQTA